MSTRTISDAGGNWNATGTWVEGAVPTSLDDVVATATSGNLTINVIANCKSIDFTNYTGQVTHNAVVLAVYGSALFVAGMSYVPAAGAAIRFGANGTLTTAGLLMTNISALNGAVLTLGDNLNFTNIPTVELNLYGTGTVDLNGQLLSGNSTINRVLITSSILGSSKIIIVNGGTFANCDFRDIAFNNGGADLDLSGITGGSGDALGNGMSGGGTLTLTTPAEQTWTNVNGGNWSDVANWSGRVPLPQDDVSFACAFGASKTVTADMPRLGKSISWVGATGTPTWNVPLATSPHTLYGSLTIISAMNVTAYYTHIFEGRGAYTLTGAGKYLGGVIARGVGGSLTMMDALNVIGFNAEQGTCYFGSFSHLMAQYFLASGSVNVYFQSCSITIPGGTAYNPWNVTTSGVLDTGTSVINLTYAGALTPQRFVGGGKTYNSVVISAGGAGAWLFSGNNTFANFTVNAPKTLTITSGSIQTFINAPVMVGSLGNLITINASGAAAGNLAKASGIVSCDYLSLTKSAAGGGATWYAGANSQDVSGNSGWIFTAPPSAYVERQFPRGIMRGVWHALLA